mgnify:CR=1 FL=1
MSSTKQKRLFIIDGYATLYRAHYALIRNPLTNSAGTPTSAIFGFANQVFQLIEEEKPDYLVAAFDSKGKNFRHEIFSDYKANRSEMPDEIQTQLPYLWTLLKAMNIPVLRVDGVEADDIIGTVAKKCSESDLQCNIVSGDKDFMQLIDNSTFLYAPQARKREKEIFELEIEKNYLIENKLNGTFTFFHRLGKQLPPRRILTAFCDSTEMTCYRTFDHTCHMGHSLCLCEFACGVIGFFYS